VHAEAPASPVAQTARGKEEAGAIKRLGLPPQLPHDVNERGVHKGTQTVIPTFAPRKLTVAPD
jgi:hypothetical protein